MFQQRANETRLQSAVSMVELIFHSSAHTIRKGHRNAVMSIVTNMVRVILLIVIFYLLYTVLGLRRAAIRGDFVLFMMSGVFIYMTHVRTVSAVMGSEGPASPMMKHAPMNTIVSIAAAAISTLYIQVLTMALILFVYYVAISHFSIQDPAGAFGCILVAWLYGIAVGTVFLALKPWAPEITGILSTVYQRANMIASGKMFVANQINPKMRNLFDWNPLYHSIDQARGDIFINYNPHFSSLSYALYVALALFCIGMIGEFYTSRRASISWDARR
ncbi:ABC transporter permease [Pseudooceanicola sediminis]|uniref:ABC transporter permease n=1 Tax=Pseudooceanicola sediminis TaxID=2211117 RepID=A0A399J5J6_9RHOB|nr:ABC transporter permease [Pseudooceanicola sediminis]KAA2315694.1 ABC transporter permease [Puniceibacterium sp. HSS470]RII40450.1 ABC transporter permease [Pseudooceanicola sediminis]